MASPRLSQLTFGLLLLGAACGDDGTAGATTSDDSDGPSTGSPATGTADDGPSPGTMTSASGPTTGGDESTTASADDATTGTTAGTGDDTTAGMPSTGSSDDGSSGGSGSSDSGGESSSSSDDGMAIPECEMCEEGEVCVAYQAFVTSYECHPLPAECAGDVDCDCGGSLCTEPFVGCSDAPQPDTLFCACIAC